MKNMNMSKEDTIKNKMKLKINVKKYIIYIINNLNYIYLKKIIKIF